MTYLFAYICSAAIAISFRGTRRAIPWVGLAGMIGWAGFDIARRLHATPGLAVFVGALALGTMGEILAWRLREPAILFVIPGLFPLVPGLIAYEGMLLLSREQASAAALKISQALFFAGALAAGLGVAPALFRRVRR